MLSLCLLDSVHIAELPYSLMQMGGATPVPSLIQSEAQANLRESPNRIRSLASWGALTLDQPEGDCDWRA
jgi:hypothetical protein